MRQLFFNDLSLLPLAKDFTEAWQRVDRLIKTYKARPIDVFGTRICCDDSIGNFQLAKDLDLQTFCRNPAGRTLGTLLLGLTKHPYIMSGSAEEDIYLKSEYLLEINGDEVEAYGLTAALLRDSAGVGFASEPCWADCSFYLVKKGASGREKQKVLCVSEPEHFHTPDFLSWYEEKVPTSLISTKLSPSMKKIALRDDHGKNTLDNFARKLVCSPYVIEIVNSMPFNPHFKDFIKSTNEDGLIEIVLAHTDQGLGMVVKTTGRNLRETKAIAAILQKQFKD